MLGDVPRREASRAVPRETNHEAVAVAVNVAVVDTVIMAALVIGNSNPMAP